MSMDKKFYVQSKKCKQNQKCKESETKICEPILGTIQTYLLIPSNALGCIRLI